MGLDRTTRLLFIGGGIMIVLALAFGVYTLIANTAAPPTLVGVPTGSPSAGPGPPGAGQSPLAQHSPPAQPGTPVLTATVTAATPRAASPTAQAVAATPTAATAAAATPTTEAAATPPVEASAGTGDGGVTAYLTPLRRPIVYSAMGASDTVGVGADIPDKQAWPVVIASHLPPGTRFQRFARGGITLGDALTTELPPTIQSHPTLVTVWLVANDLTHGVPLATYQQQLNTLLQRLTTETQAQIVLLNLPDLSLVLAPGRYPGTPEELRAVVQSWNVAIAATAAPYGDRVLLVDLFPGTVRITVDTSLISGDDWHPSTSGYAAIAGLVEQTMQDAGLLPAAGP